MRRKVWTAVALLVVGILLAAGQAFCAEVELMSIASDGTQGNEWSGMPAISADGRFVAFWSRASNLVPGDTNGAEDVFVRDRLLGTMECVSVTALGRPGNGNSGSDGVAISADGRFVAFYSEAGDLVVGDTNGVADAFVFDRLTHTMERVSVSSSGAQADGASGDFGLAISSDGQFVVFDSLADNLVPGDTNTVRDVFVRDRQAGTTERVSVTGAGQQANGLSTCSFHSISADGRFVIFQSGAGNLVAGDTNGLPDIFVRDRALGVTERVNVSTTGAQANGYSYGGVISPDGSCAAFVSSATDLVPSDTNGFDDIFLRDLAARTTELVSVSDTGQQANSDSFGPSLSSDGQVVAFGSYASNLVIGDANALRDTFVRDRALGTTAMMSATLSGLSANGESVFSDITPDGKLVVFDSTAPDVLPTDTNGWPDVFLRDRRYQLGCSLSVTGDHGQVKVDGALHDLPYQGSFPFGTQVTLEAVPGSLAQFKEWSGGLTGGQNPATITLDDDKQVVAVFISLGTFSDVFGDYWAFTEIESCAAAGIVAGYPDGTYQPGSQVTRDQMAVYISRALAGGDAKVPTGYVTASFPDVPVSYWAFKYVEYAKEKSIVTGYPDGTYGPTNPVDRGQMAVYISRGIANPTGDEGLAGYSPPASPSFPDVGADYYAYKYIEYVKSKSVVSGYPDGTYQPAVVVTRDQMAVYVARAFQLPM